jgi:hypothetical protein
MFRREPETRDFFIALMVTGLLVAGFFAYSHHVAVEPHRPGATESSVNAQRRSTAKTDPVPIIATVYECNGDDGHVLSDKPCGDGARTREVAQPNLMPAPQNIGSHRVPAKRDPSRVTPRPGSLESVRRADEICASIDTAIDQINARMRHKYTNSEGEYLRQRLRELSDQRWNAKCIHG